MRYLTIALLLFFPLAADAEQRSSSARSRRAEALARSPEMVRPLAGARRPETRAEQDARRDSTHWPHTHRGWWRQEHFRHQMPFGSFYAVPNTGYGFGFYAPGPPQEAQPRQVEDRARIVTTGVLRLEVTPGYGLEYYVDGHFMGSSANLGTQLELNAGARRVEIRANGYKPIVFDTRITEGGETTFRGALEPVGPPPPAPPQATGSRTIYIIPGCYVGNARPSADGMRPGCDINKLITR